MLKSLPIMKLNKTQIKTTFILVVTLLIGTFNQPLVYGAVEPNTGFEVSLYTGIPGVGQLGATYKSITENTKIPFSPIDITEDEELLKAGIVYGIAFDTIGAKVYFKRQGSCLITLQPPFKGFVKNKKIQLFDMKKPTDLNWEEAIIKELGQPESQGTGGLFGGDIFYYSWGDIEVSRIGLRQLMLYRDRAVAEYRKTIKTSIVKPFKK